MEGSLVILRVIGGILGVIFVLWAFGRFRLHMSSRHEFLLISLLGIGLIILSVYPNSVNILASMLSLEDKQFGRLITLLIFSNILLWFLVFGLRSKDFRSAIQFDLLVRHFAAERFFKEFGFDQIKDITVIIPALDEAENLKQILPRMPKEIKEHELGVIVVDDGSVDDTAMVVKEHGYHVVSNPINRGGGAALRLGYDIAVLGSTKIVVTMDGDGQHEPEEIERLVEPILNDEVDFVIGSRVLGKREKDSVFRWIGIHIFNLIINILSSTRITDCSNGFRAFRVDALKKVFLLQDQFHTDARPFDNWFSQQYTRAAYNMLPIVHCISSK